MDYILDDRGIENLIVGIIEQAVDDYLKNRFDLDVAPLRWPEKNSERFRYGLASANKKYLEAKSFFHSKWYHDLIGNTMDGFEPIDDVLAKRYKDYFPFRMAKFRKQYGTRIDPIKAEILFKYVTKEGA